MARGEIPILQFSPFLVSLHDDDRWEAWWTVASQLFLSEVDHQVAQLLMEHIRRHPELYESTGPERTSG